MTSKTMPRTNTLAVQSVLLDNYGPTLQGTLPDLTPFILAANILTNQVVYMSSQRYMHGGMFPIQDTGSTSQATVIETWLAAHFYAQADQIFSQKSTGGASATYQGQTQMFLENSKYGQMALRMDFSGSLEALDKRKIASAQWLGTCPINWWAPLWAWNSGSSPQSGPG